MCDSTLLLIKEKIIHTDAIIKLLSDKNTQINQLKRQLKFLYKTYLAKTKELEICNLKETTNPSYINEKILLEKYTKLEAIHQDYVNVSTIKYQNICKELEESKSSKPIKNIKTIKKCNKCKDEVENNRVLKRQITHLKQNIAQLTNKVESKNKNNLKDFKYSPEYKRLKQDHDTEIESLMTEHMMELDKMKTKFKGEINNYQEKIISLEAQHMIYKDKIDELKLELSETKILVMEKNTVKSKNKISNEIKGGLYDLLSDCDLDASKDDLISKLDQSSQTDEIFYHISNDINRHENVDIASLFGDDVSDVLNDHQENFVELSNLDRNQTTLKCLEEVKEDLNDENLDVWRCIQEMKEIPEPLSSMSSSENEEETTPIKNKKEETTTSKKNNEKETTTSKKNNVFNKRLKLKRLAQENRRKFITNMKKDLFKSIVKYVGKMIKSNDRENKTKKMSKRFKNKRKLEMLRWTALREISSTDSDVSSTSKSKIKMRKLKYKHLKVNNKEEYNKFCEKLNTMTTFYNSLSTDESKIEDNCNVGEESGQDSGFGKSDIECGRINKCGDDKRDKLGFGCDKKISHDDLIEHQIDTIENNLNEIEFLQNFDSNKSFEQGSSSENDNLSSHTKVSSDLVKITSLESSENELFENKISQNYNSNKSFGQSLSSDTKVSSDLVEMTSLESSENELFENKISQNYTSNKSFGQSLSSDIDNLSSDTKVSSDLVEMTSLESSENESFENKKEFSQNYSSNKLFGQNLSSDIDNLSSDTKLSSDLVEMTSLESSENESFENKKESSQNYNSNKSFGQSLSSDTKVSSDLVEMTSLESSENELFENKISQNYTSNKSFGQSLSSDIDNLSSDTKVSSDLVEMTSLESSENESFENKKEFSQNYSSNKLFGQNLSSDIDNLSSDTKLSSDLVEMTSLESSENESFENKKEFSQNYSSNKLFGQSLSSDIDNLSSDTKLSSDLVEMTSLESSENESFENKKESSQNYNSNKLFGQSLSSDIDNLSSDTKLSSELVEMTSLESSENESFENKKVSSQNYSSNKLFGQSLSSDTKLSSDLVEMTSLESSENESFENKKESSQNYNSNKLFGQSLSFDIDNLSSDTKVSSELVEMTSLESSENESFENKKGFSQNCNSKKSFGQSLSCDKDNLSTDTKISNDSLEIASFKGSSQNKIELSQNCNFNNLFGQDSSSEDDNFSTHRKVSDDLLKITPFKETSQSDSFENDNLSSHTKVSSDLLEITSFKEPSQSDSFENKIESSQNKNLSSQTKVSSDSLQITSSKETYQSVSVENKTEFLQNYNSNKSFGEDSSSENDNLSSQTKVSDDFLQITSFKEPSQSDSFENKIKSSQNENLSSQTKVFSDLLEITPFKEPSQSDLFENNNDEVSIKKSETSPSETNSSQRYDNCVKNSFKNDNKKEKDRRCSPRINKLKRQQNKNRTKEIIKTKQLTNSILDLIPICEPTKPSISSNNKISDTPQNNSDESNKLELANSKFPCELNENDVPVRPVKRRKANLKRTIDVSDAKITSNGEPSKKLKKVKDGCLKRFENDSVIKEVIKVERKIKLEKTCFKRPVKRKLCTPMSPPHSTVCEFVPPKIIPLDVVGQLHAGVGKKLLKKLIQFPGESVILQDIIDKFSSQTQNYVISVIIEEVLIDTSKSDNKFTPPAPILTPVQRTLLGLTIKLQESFPDILTEILFSLERSILSETGLNRLISLARFYTGICKLKKELHRMRRMIGDVFFILNDLAIPFLYTVLSTWTEILPLEAESHDNMLVKVLIQIINMKNCEPGYCLTTLKGLLQNYYGYPKERWKSEDVFNETFIKFKENPSKFLEFALLILFKNHPNKWVFEQMGAHLKPLLNNSTDNHIKKAIVVLISNTLPQFGSDNSQYVQEIETWLKNLNSVM